METHFQCLENWGRSQNSDSVSAQSLLWDQQVFYVNNLASKKLMGSLATAWSKRSLLCITEISAHPTSSLQKWKGLVTQVCICAHDVARHVHKQVCTNDLGGKVVPLIAILPSRLPWPSQWKKASLTTRGEPVTYSSFPKTKENVCLVH